MTANPLVAGPVDTSTAFGGAGVLESVTDLCSSLESGSWVAAGLAGVGAALDVAATVIDPLGSLIGAGLGWLMEHLEPLKGWLDDLTGDPGAVLGLAGTWQNVADAMGAAGDELTRVVRADLEAMTGSSISAYSAYADGLADRIRATGSSASAIGGALKTCAMVVQVVHDLVRDTLASLVGSIISWAAEAVFTLGLATPVIVGQVSTRVSSLATKVGRSVTDVVSSAKSLKNLLEALQDVLRRLASGVRGKLPGAKVPDGPTPRSRGNDLLPPPEPFPHLPPPVPIDRSLVDDSILSALDPATPRDAATFWSGRVVVDGVEVKDGAMNGARALTESTHGSTLEQLLEQRGLADRMPTDWSDIRTIETWRAVSTELAAHASGDVRAVLGEVRPTSVWNEHELPTLIRNPDVSSVTVIDAATGKVIHVYRR